MNPDRRAAYLRALDVTVYRPRAVAGSVPATSAAVEPEAAARAQYAVGAPRSAVSATAPPASAASLDALCRQVAECRRCKLCEARTQTVFAAGSPRAELMVIGEGPGADEDAKGLPFVGRAGRLLDQMLLAIGRSRAGDEPPRSVYIANVVKCRPPGNRDPQPDEVEACRPYLDRQIELVAPKLIVALGRVAAQRLLGVNLPLSKLRGGQYEYGPRNTPVLLTYHPAYLLRSPSEKAKAWDDLKRIHRFLVAASK
ncbi:MAG: uracil-DNA glycosylase [Gammaproteobacteria bacterium]|nr:uracil-DNA glycosylase [Gammaproteobacteria bacterium]